MLDSTSRLVDTAATHEQTKDVWDEDLLDLGFHYSTFFNTAATHEQTKDVWDKTF